MSEGVYLGALDQGTTGSRFIVFDTQGHVVRQAYKRHRQFYPNPGWVEHDPKELLSNVRGVIRACLKGSDFKLATIGLTNQRETVLCWDAKQESLCTTRSFGKTPEQPEHAKGSKQTGRPKRSKK